MNNENLLDIVGKRIGDTNDLPEAIKKVLVTGKLDELEERILRTLKHRYEGIASIDELIVGIFRDFEHITEDRRAFANKLYRMQKSGLIDSVAKRKGIYKLKEQTPESF